MINNTTYLSRSCKSWGDLLIAVSKEEAKHYLQKTYDLVGITHDIQTSPVADISVKDELSLMDIATFNINKVPDLKNLFLEYHLKDVRITISGLGDCGIATVHDYDIVLYMVSYLSKEMDKIKKLMKDAEEQKKTNPNKYKVINPELPSRYFEPDVDILLEFCGRTRGGAQRQNIQAALTRLRGTTISIERTCSNGYRRDGVFGYINDFQILSRTKSGVIEKVRIGIPDWIYDGIVRIGTPTVLSMNREYFELSDGIQKFLHRYARKVAGFGTTVKIPVEEIHKRSGSRQELKYFTRDLRTSLKKLSQKPLSDYSIEYLSEGRGKNFVIFQKRPTEHALSKAECPIELDEELKKQAQEIAPLYDPDWLFLEWVKWTSKKVGWSKVRRPKNAFLQFCKTNNERKTSP